ncbi:SGNH/GDSL hydrolase family protein [Bradyrhizobium manausense]|uniref:SGNH/GDSL hydrolase family protein n=1 Tax=Bradyrhizobium manausense TaxID=989370 RepID=UPI001BA56274|nr:SGNH/GDSL hydrolase family protein [Bradyrhizobium manausense]MBR0720596.1 SGNH/GDSL hydrolase family protein [Bradyrhizobium manausense]MBR0837384.1 SGNH/GDSL hydrolase family protein [Bradyrhizobium manausense]
MKAKVLLSLILLCGGLAAPSARAGDAVPAAPAACELPPYLLATDSQLHKVADTVKSGKPLEILVIGSRSTTIPAQEDSSYPARMQAVLKDKLPPAETVHVSVEIQSKKTAEEAAGTFVKLMEAKAPTLVIWQTGTVDAIRSVDPDDFRGAVTEGVAALQNAGADVVLMNLQYSPRTETMISAPPYLDNMRVVAQEHDIPLFDRFAMMRQWNDQGQFDLFSPSRGPELAKQVHDCIGRALAQFVMDAAHLGPAEQQN